MIASIQILRAIAATMVVLFHIVGGMAMSGGIFLQSGVDIFFVISGFIMMETTTRKPVGGWQFLLNRIIRVVPLYWICTAIYIAMHQIPPIGDILKSLLFIFYRNSLTGDPNPIVTPGWTLNYEMYFYCLFALLIPLSVRAKVLIMGAWFLGAAALHRHFNLNDAFLFRMTSPLPLEFLAGMLLSTYRPVIQRIAGAFGLGAVAIGFAALALSPHAYEPRVVFYGLPAIVIVAGALTAEPLLRHRALAPMIALGNASYSLYLTHIITLDLMRYVFPTAAHGLNWQGLVNLAASCMVALLTYRWVERPATVAIKSMVDRLAGRRLATAGSPAA